MVIFIIPVHCVCATKIKMRYKQDCYCYVLMKHFMFHHDDYVSHQVENINMTETNIFSIC